MDVLKYVKNDNCGNVKSISLLNENVLSTMPIFYFNQM